MRISSAVVAMTAVLTAACGWSPPGPAPTSTQACGPGPSAQSVATEISMLPQASWTESARGHAADCRLNWVVVSSGAASDSPQQVLFFDGDKGVGSPTPEPRPYITVTAQGDHDARVQYQWRQGADPACCPTGVGSARVTLEDGRLTILDPIPGP